VNRSRPFAVIPSYISLQRVGWSAWLLLIIVVAVLVLIDPYHRTVAGVYRDGAQAWWNSQAVYGTGVGGFLYFPSSLLIYSPFWALGARLGDLLWRLVSVGLLTVAILRLARLATPEHVKRLVPLTLLLSIPGSAEAIRNGQATVLMLAMMIFATLYLAERRWLGVTICLSLALAVKPIVLPFFLLTAVLYWRPLAWRLLLGVTVILAVTFIHPDPAYVVQEYMNGIKKIIAGSDPRPGRYHDSIKMLAVFGLTLPALVVFALRSLAAIGTLAVTRLAVRRHDPVTGAVLLLTFANGYLMLFSPRTESNTYIMLAVLVAFFAAYSVLVRGRRGVAIGLGAICIGLGAQGYGTFVFRLTEMWLKPALCIVFVLVMTAWTFGPEPLRLSTTETVGRPDENNPDRSD
jgi:hypothetical protein